MHRVHQCLPVLVALTAQTLAAAQPDLVLGFRDATGAYAMTALGDIYVVHNSGVEKLLTLRDAADRPFRWNSTPTGLAKWRSEWIVCDNSPRLLHFSAAGSFTKATESPVRVANITVAGDQLVILNLIAGSPPEQLWTTRDGVDIVRIPLPGQEAFESPLENLLIIAGNARGEIYAAQIIGPPLIRVLWPAARQRVIATGYSRTAFRAGLEQPLGMVDDVGPYSQPVRDLFPLPDGGIVALRNREDVRNSTGQPDTIVGRRADRYDPSGRHNATAEFPSTMRWVTAVTAKTVRAVTRSGDVMTVPWGEPKMGEILKPRSRP